MRRIGDRGNHDYRHILCFGVLGQLLADVQSIEDGGHHDVQQHEVWMLSLDLLQRLLAVRCSDYSIAVRLENGAHDLHEIRIVIYDKDLGR